MFNINPHSKTIVSGFGIDLSALDYIAPFDDPTYGAILEDMLNYQNRYTFQIKLTKINKQLLKENKPFIYWQYISDDDRFYLYMSSKQLYEQTSYSKHELIKILRNTTVKLLCIFYDKFCKAFPFKTKLVSKQNFKIKVTDSLTDNLFQDILDADTNLDL